MASCGDAKRTGPPLQRDRAAQAVGRIDAEDGLEQLRPAGAHEPGHAHDLAAPHGQGHVVERPGRAPCV